MKKGNLSAEILEECLRRIQEGEALESVLTDYAGMADELRPLLEAARSLSKPVYVPQAARARSQARFLTAARQTRQAKTEQARYRLLHDLRRPVLLWRWLPVRIVAALSLVLALLTSGFYGVNHVAAQSIPGDRLYPVKLVVEQVQLQFAPNAATRLKLETEFDQLRKVEVESLIQDSRTGPVVFTGFAAQGVSGKWMVNGIPVDLTPAQEKQLAASQKVLVQVQGQVQTDGSVLVQNTEPHPINFQGKVEAVAAQAWQIDGVKVGVSNTTRFSGNPQVGSSVNVVALEDNDDSLEAVSVDASDTQGQSGVSLQKTPTPTSPPAQNYAPHDSDGGGED
jgi:hypothetical protein